MGGWYREACHEMAWHGTSRHGVAWRGVAWDGMGWHGVKECVQGRTALVSDCVLM